MKTRKLIKFVGWILLTLFVIFLLIVAFGNLAVDHYLNADGRKDLTKFLPINGTATYERASVKLFRSFPDVTLQLEGLKLGDSLATSHNYPPLILDELNVRASIKDLRKKKFEVEAVDLDGLTVNLFNDKHGYSNIANLIRKKVKKATDEKKEAGVEIEYGEVDLNISNIRLNKIDEQIGQKAHVAIENIIVDNKLVNEQYALGLEMKQLLVADEVINGTTRNPIQLDKILANVALDKSFAALKLEEIILNKGHIHLLNDSLGQSNYQKIFGTSKKNSVEKSNKKSGLAINIDGVKVELDDIDFKLVDDLKNKHLAARIIKVGSQLQAKADTSALVDVLLDVDQLAFNTNKGAYLRNSLVEGQIQTDISHDLISLVSQPLMINDEKFDVKAKLYSDKKSTTTLTIEKDDVLTSKVKPLLTQGIQNSISAYDVNGPFYTKAHIEFTPGKKDPRVAVDLIVNNKTVRAKGQTIKNTNVSATFVNRLYDDGRQFNEDKRNVRFMIHSLHGVFNELQVESQNAVITSTPNGGDRLIGKANITGRAASMSKYLKHDKFNFQDGNFTLSTDINGSLNNLDDLISGTNLSLAMKDLEVHYPEGNAIFPFRILDLTKKGNKTLFHFEGYTDNNTRPFHIRGEVDRVEALLFPSRADRMQAKANIRASSVSWEGVIALFGKDGIMSSFKKADEKQAKRSMKQTLSGIEKSFHPVVSVVIDTVFYGKDLELRNFTTGIKFDDERTLVLEETTFQVDKSNVSLDGEVKINQLDFTRFDFDIELSHLDFDALMPKFDYFGIHLIKQIHDQPDDLSMKIKLSGELDDDAGLRPESINADITYESHAEDKFTGSLRLNANPATKKVDVVFGHSGHPRSFNHLLGSDNYRFDHGWYTVSFQFDDNFETLAQMVEESTFNLTIDDAEVYMKSLGVTVPLTRIEVASIKNKAYYHLLLRSDTMNQELAFNGVVDNIRHFAFKDTDQAYQVEMEISSPRIVWEDLKQIIDYNKKDSSQVKSGKLLKESLAKVLSDFNPNVTLKVKKLEYSDKINFNDIFAHAYMDNNKLKIDSANVAYGTSRVLMNLEADMGHEHTLPLDMQLHLTNIDVHETLEHFDYFNKAELRDAKRIEGNIWLDLDLSAEMDLVNQGFNTEQTVADVFVKLENVVIEDLQTIDTISIGMGFDRRLDVLSFAPIESQLKIRGNRIEVKQTEIQSNAMHAFIEGAIDKDSPESLWISVPLKNIKKPDLETVSDKTGYEGAGKKVYLQLISSHDEDDGKMKVHLRKKKFFQERFKAKQFRGYKRINRRARRALRREARQSK